MDEGISEGIPFKEGPTCDKALKQDCGQSFWGTIGRSVWLENLCKEDKARI